MCGIQGKINACPRSTDLPVQRLHHRGPDANGSTTIHLPWAEVHAGATRLTIVDQNEIEVPFQYPELGVVLAYNGEVYNWRELRAELSGGTPWRTQCDAEVVARAWRRWGPDMLSRLNGMFALALFDTRTGQVLLARDRAGEKPLYYAVHDGALHFASEIKALDVPLREAPCPEVLVLEFDCLETTPLEGVKRLLPGHRILLTRPEDIHNPKPEPWWQPPTEIDETMGWDQAVEETKAILTDSIRMRVPDEVSYGVLISGGLDSAIVQAVARLPPGHARHMVSPRSLVHG
jgi:asparagine synthase (glutamine-hydrolysing)